MHMDNAVLPGLTDKAMGPELAKAPTGMAGLDQITGAGVSQSKSCRHPGMASLAFMVRIRSTCSIWPGSEELAPLR